MSKGYHTRRSIFRRDAGRAFLRFLIGEVLLVVLCGVFYLFVLQGKIDLPVSFDSATPSPAPTETIQPTAVPTIEPTAEPTQAPTPEPTATPIPVENLALTMQTVMPGLPETNSTELKLGLKEFKIFTDGGQSVLVIRGYAYIEGADAAQSTGYIVLADAISGEIKGMYPVTPNADDADLSFDESSGVNLDQAFFQLNLDTASIGDGIYLMSMAVVGEGKTVWNYFDSSMFHFSIQDGVVTLPE